MVKIGVLGAGHLGKIHIKLLKQIEAVELVGFYDPDRKKAEEVATEYDVKSYPLMDKLLDAVDAVDIVTPTLSHFECASQAVKAGKHVFIEKPMTNTPVEAKELIRLVEESGVKAQVGHVERFNPAVLSLEGMALNPMFVEAHRLAMFNPRGTDVSVVHDLMIHDIDVLLSMVKGKVKKVNASGVPVISDSPDIANARIEFDNGCVANLTASRISMKNMRKMRLFQKNTYITIDFGDRKSEVFRLKDLAEGEEANMTFELPTEEGVKRKALIYDTPAAPEVNAIKMELETFCEAIENDKEPRVSVVDGYEALKVAHHIVQHIDEDQKLKQKL